MVGVLMLIAIFVAAVAVIAVVLFGTTPPDQNPAVNLRITNESGLIKIYHAGGDVLMSDKLQIFVDGTLSPFIGFGPEGTWSNQIDIFYSVPGPAMPNKIDIVYSENPLGGSNAALIATLFLGNMTNVQQDVSRFTIVASTGTGGSISPYGTQFVTPGDSVQFVITANPGYAIADVVVDGISIGPVTEYQFSSVGSSHTISVTFAPTGLNLFRINVTSSEGGTVTPGNVTVPFGTDQTFTMTPYPYYSVGSVRVNGTIPSRMSLRTIPLR